MSRKLTFQLNDSRIVTVRDDDLYDTDSADNSTSYDLVHRVPSRAFGSTRVQRAVRLDGPEGASVSCIIVFQGATPLRDSNVAIHENQLFLAAGVSLAAVDLACLNLNWYVDLLSGADNGMYFPPADDCILAIGDFDVTCIELNGQTRWATTVSDLLTPGVTADGRVVVVVDDHGSCHGLSIDTGERIVG